MAALLKMPSGTTNRRKLTGTTSIRLVSQFFWLTRSLATYTQQQIHGLSASYAKRQSRENNWAVVLPEKGERNKIKKRNASQNKDSFSVWEFRVFRRRTSDTMIYTDNPAADRGPIIDHQGGYILVCPVYFQVALTRGDDRKIETVYQYTSLYNGCTSNKCTSEINCNITRGSRTVWPWDLGLKRVHELQFTDRRVSVACCACCAWLR